jgi:Mn2+/Fe2+ NRAMP family transporter
MGFIRNRIIARLPPRCAERLFFLGPGLILAVEASGESGITEVMRAGAEYGYALLWVILLALVFKFAFVQGIARYTVARGEHIFSGLRGIPGPRDWEVWFISVLYFFEMLGFGAIALIAGYMISFIFPGIPMTLTAFAILALALLALWKESYERLEHIVIAIAVLLFLALGYATLTLPFPGPAILAGLAPSIPEKGLLETMALLGAIGSGLNLLLYSVWLHEKIGDRHGESYFHRHMKSINLDLVLAFLIIAVVSFIFLSIGHVAFVMEEFGNLPFGQAIAEAIHRVLDHIPGGAAFFVLTSVLVLVVAVISGMDGRARAIASVLSSTGRTSRDPRSVYRGVLVGFAALITAGIMIQDAPDLIRFVSAVGAVMFGFLGFMVIYLDRRLPAYARGSSLWLLVMGSGSVLFLYIAAMSEQAILDLGIPLAERIAVVILVLYAFSRTDLFERLMTGGTTLEDTGWVVLIFGALSVYGTMRGLPYDGLLVNFAELGPMIAGILAGPVVGGLAGVIGGMYRHADGGWTVLSSSLAPVAAGVMAGIYARLMDKKIGYPGMVVLAFLVETVHVFILIPLFSSPTPVAMEEAVWAMYLPMAFANAFGLILFRYILRERGRSLMEHEEYLRLRKKREEGKEMEEV